MQSPHLVASHNGSQVFDRLDVRSEGFGNSSSYGRAARRSSPDLSWRNGLTCAFGLFSTIEDTTKSSRLVLNEILQIQHARCDVRVAIAHGLTYRGNCVN